LAKDTLGTELNGCVTLWRGGEAGFLASLSTHTLTGVDIVTLAGRTGDDPAPWEAVFSDAPTSTEKEKLVIEKVRQLRPRAVIWNIELSYISAPALSRFPAAIKALMASGCRVRLVIHPDLQPSIAYNHLHTLAPVSPTLADAVIELQYELTNEAA
jgi:hypothetical protein